jgi:ribonuclease D
VILERQAFAVNYRRRKRAFQHEEAHADATEEMTPPLEREDVPSEIPRMVTSAQELGEVIDHVRAAGLCAYDTEFIGEETYHPQICLVQLATTDMIAIIDPIALPELDPVWEMLADPSVLKLVHAGGVDLKYVPHAIGCEAANVIDTQIAAAFAGLPWPVGLARVIEAFTGHRLGKGHTFTNWDARPLSRQQLRYAADDVRYLPMLWSMLQEELERRGTLAWALSECEVRLKIPVGFDPDPHLRKISKGMRLKPRARALLRALVVERDRLAQIDDRPHRVLLPDSTLLELVRKKPKDQEEMASIRGLPRPTAQKWFAEIVAILDQVDTLEIIPDKNPKPSSEAAAEQVVVDALWMALCTRLYAQGIAPGMVISRSQLAIWYLTQKSDEQVALFADENWRQEAIGEWLTNFIEGRTKLSIGWGDRGAIVDEHSDANSASG